MARPKIRGVKPELWTDEAFVELSAYARLLWMGLWNHACDNGHLQDKSKQIKMRVLPTDDVNCTELLREIEDQGLIERADGWITIPNLSHHQKPHKRWWTTCEKPGCEVPEGASHGIPKRAATVAQPLSTSGATGDHGWSTADVDGDVEVDGEGDSDKPLSRKRSETEPPSRFEEFWETYSKKIDRKKAEAAYRTALKKPRVTEDLLIASAAAYITYQMSQGKHPGFTKAAHRWLQGECWRDERKTIQAAPPPTRVQEHLALVRQLQAEEDQPTIPQIGERR